VRRVVRVARPDPRRGSVGGRCGTAEGEKRRAKPACGSAAARRRAWVRRKGEAPKHKAPPGRPVRSPVF
jgi:hypothetical protein